MASDVVTTELFRGESSHIVYKFGTSRLSSLIYEFWSQWRRVERNREWRGIIYSIADGKFEIEFIYADKFDETEDELEKRSRIARRFFGDLPFDYSHP